MDHDIDRHARPTSTDETELERWQRNFTELLQELRVAQTGVQILFAFLLTLAFSGELQDAELFVQTNYLVALLAAAAATALLIAPVAYHRILFRQGRKPHITRAAHRMACAGLGLLAIAMIGSIMLAVDLLLPRPAAAAIALFTGLWFAVLWGLAPWALRETDREQQTNYRERVDGR